MGKIRGVLVLAAAGVLALGASALSENTKLPKGAVEVTPEQIQWAERPVPGSKTLTFQSAVLEGDMAKPGFFAWRTKLPPHAKIPPHWHPRAEHVLVLEGAIYHGFGSVMDKEHATLCKAGSYWTNPAGAKHFIFTDEEGAVVQTMGMGPFKVLDDKHPH
jgi:quercetin dioxygenase-like cupin family protein